MFQRWTVEVEPLVDPLLSKCEVQRILHIDVVYFGYAPKQVELGHWNSELGEEGGDGAILGCRIVVWLCTLNETIHLS